jgi:uncharacterized repeat protein (TIGR02543 family)
MKISNLLASFLFVFIITSFVMSGKSGRSAGPIDSARKNSGLYDGSETFSFASIGDAHAEAENFAATVNQIATMNPDFVIFNGDLENEGFLTEEMDPMIADLKAAGLFDRTFLVRGNHDDNQIDIDNAALWESYFETEPNIKTPPAGVTNYVSIDSDSDNLTYSFNFGNSIFIGLDVPGPVDDLTADEYYFLDDRLTYAENLGLTHAFIYFHGPSYCVESNHCDCFARTDASCTPSELVAVINDHPIVSATFHGHEHIFGWTHMDSTRLAGLTGSFEQFLTSPAGGWNYNDAIYPERLDYYVPDMDEQPDQGFGYVTVDGDSFTVSFYKDGSTSPNWSGTFQKPGMEPTLTQTLDPSGGTLLVDPYVANTTTSPTPSINISWVTDTSNTGEVHYSLDQNYGNTVTATSNLWDGRYWYSATLTGLAANTTYYYKIYNGGYDKTPWSPITFTTAPDATGNDYHFVVLGDSQPASATAAPYQATWDIANQMTLTNPNLVIHTGDMIYDDATCTGNSSPYSQFVRNYFNVYQVMLGKIPFFNTIGNHEVHSGGTCGYPAYKNIFDLPKNAPSGDAEEYYSFDWGNAHFIVLDTNQYYATGYPESTWLESDLQNTTKPWKFVFLHVPAYSSGGSGSDPDVQAYFVPLFETYGVDAVFNGHDHAYERTCPILDSTCATIEDGGVVYFTNGGGGAYTEMPSGAWFTAAKANTNEFLDITMNDCQVELNAIDEHGTTFDTYTIDHCSSTNQLTVNMAGTGSGTVTSDPTGISCSSGTCSHSFDYGTLVTLSASVSTGSTFTGWDGEGCSGTGTCQVTMSAARSVTATFTLNTYALDVTMAGTGSGTVTSNPAGITCTNGTCSHSFNYNTSVTLSASASTGSTFTGWSGACTNSTGTCTVTMDAAKSVTATFTLNTYMLTVDRAGSGTGTVTSLDGGISCGSTCSHVYDYNTSVTLSASASTGSTFTGWSGACTNSTGTCTVTMSAARSVTATFVSSTSTLTVNKAGNGAGTVTSSPAGIDCGSTCSYDFAYNTVVSLSASAPTGSTFTGWSGIGISCPGTGTCTVTMDAAKSVTATFTLNTYGLTVDKTGTGTGTVVSSPSGIDCGSTCSYGFNYNSIVTLAAIPSANSTFTGWSGEGCSGTGICQVTMSAARTVAATFSAGTSAILTVSKTGTGTGTVTSSPAGIDCGSTCSYSFNFNTVVTLSAVASTGSTFTGWSGEGCSGTGNCQVTMSAAGSVTATFSLNTYNLTVNKADTGTGIVTSSPSGIDCGSTCSYSFDYNTSVTLTAVASSDSTFSGWGGACNGTGNCQVIMSAARTVTATFTIKTYSLTVTSLHGTVSRNPDKAAYTYGEEVQLTATPETGWNFTGWSGDANGSANPILVKMNGDKTVTANYTANQYKVMLPLIIVGVHENSLVPMESETLPGVQTPWTSRMQPK